MAVECGCGMWNVECDILLWELNPFTHPAAAASSSHVVPMQCTLAIHILHTTMPLHNAIPLSPISRTRSHRAPIRNEGDHSSMSSCDQGRQRRRPSREQCGCLKLQLCCLRVEPLSHLAMVPRALRCRCDHLRRLCSQISHLVII